MSVESAIESDLDVADLMDGEAPLAGSRSLPEAELVSRSPPVSGVGAMAESLTGLQKAAVFILSLEEDVASVLLRSLTDAELGRITAEIANLGVVDKDTVSSVLREFSKLEHFHSMAREGGLENAMRLVEKTFPAEKARRIGQLLASHRQHYPFSFLEGVEPETLLVCLADEHPQTLAVILAHMNPIKAAEILERLPASEQREVLERVAGLEGTNTEALQSLESSLRKQLEAARFESLGESAGVKAVAEILRAAGGGASILDGLRQGRPELAEEIGKHMFGFEDLLAVHDRALQLVLKEIDPRRLAVALKNAPDEQLNKVLNNLSRRTAELLREELDGLGPVRFVDIEASRRSILETALKLEAAGQLFISGHSREEDRLVY